MWKLTWAVPSYHNIGNSLILMNKLALLFLFDQGTQLCLQYPEPNGLQSENSLHTSKVYLCNFPKWFSQNLPGSNNKKGVKYFHTTPSLWKTADWWILLCCRSYTHSHLVDVVAEWVILRWLKSLKKCKWSNYFQIITMCYIK